jgi:chromosome segregation ATPase
MDQHAVEEDPLAPLSGLVERLRAEVTELQERWETLSEELEAKRQKLRLAEATVEALQRRGRAAAPSQEKEQEEEEEEEEKPAGGGGRHAEVIPENMSQAAQASVGSTGSA